MDPDANLQEQLELAARFIRQADAEAESLDLPEDFAVVDMFDGLKLAELVQALDNWLAVGGFAPKRWITDRQQARQAIRTAILGEHTPGQLPGLDTVTDRVLIALFGSET